MSSESRRLSIDVSSHAERDLAKLLGAITRIILGEIAVRLGTKSIRENKTRIKRLTGFSPPLYRLTSRRLSSVLSNRLQHVVILGVFHKKDSDRWLKGQG